MARNYYIFKSGRLKRKQNTLFLETDDMKRPIPVEEVEQLFVFGEIDLNTRFLDFLSKNGIVIHFFNHYGFYTGTFYPRESLLSGTLIIKQVEHYLDSEKRLKIARAFVEGALHNIKRNIEKREGFEDKKESIARIMKELRDARNIQELMSYEASARRIYYSCWEDITGWIFEERTIRPPENPLNALLSFGNSLVYATVLKEIYVTALNPTISYLHEPSERRFSLALDVSEVFKPVLVDRLIFRLINLGQIKEDDFIKELNFSYLNEKGRKIFVKAYDEFLNTTLVHRNLKRKVKYGSFIKLELYKLIKHLLGEKEYKPLKVWW